MANALSSWGYASLTLDERGNGGETRGSSPMDFTTGYDTYRSGGTPAQYAQIYDVLLAYDYVRSRKDLDGGNVSVLGESMGGRFAIVAAGIEPGFKAAFVVSSSPYGLDAGNNTDALRFVDSVEPATYLEKLPPRKLVMFHFTNDTIIPIAYGRSLYDSASQPKAWYQVQRLGARRLQRHVCTGPARRAEERLRPMRATLDILHNAGLISRKRTGFHCYF